MRFVLTVVVAAALAGCAGNGPPPATPTPTPIETQTGSGVTIDQLEQQVFNPHCLSAGCHNAGDDAGSLILEPGRAWGELVEVTPDNPAAAEAGWQRADAQNPDNSFLLKKLEGVSGIYGSRMPLAQPALSEADINLVRQWILDGCRGRTGPSPTFPPTATPTAVPTATQSVTASATPVPSDTPTSTPTPTLTATFTRTPTGTLAPSSSPTITPSPTETETRAPSPSPTATATVAVVTFAQIEETIFRPSCAVQFCHNSLSGSFSGNLNLEAAVAYDQLVGVKPDNASAGVAGLKRVDPGLPDNSFLLRKVCRPVHGEDLCPDTLPRELGSVMPMVGAALATEQVQAIHDWILRGAPRSE